MNNNALLSSNLLLVFSIFLLPPDFKMVCSNQYQIRSVRCNLLMSQISLIFRVRCLSLSFFNCSLFTGKSFCSFICSSCPEFILVLLYPEFLDLLIASLWDSLTCSSILRISYNLVVYVEADWIQVQVLTGILRGWWCVLPSGSCQCLVSSLMLAAHGNHCLDLLLHYRLQNGDILFLLWQSLVAVL